MTRVASLLLATSLLSACGGSASTPPPLTRDGLSSVERSAFTQESLLYFFVGNGEFSQDGAGPRSSLLPVGDALVGTTVGGGTQDAGTLFWLTPPNPGQTFWNERDYSITSGANGPKTGQFPPGDVIQVGSNFFGAMASGGANGNGTIVELTPQSGSPPSEFTETTLYAFTGGRDGGTPVGGLVAFGSRLIGATSSGGANGIGTIYELFPPSSGTRWSETTLAQLSSATGWRASGDFIVSGNAVYGTLALGGPKVNPNGCGCGSVFALTPPSQPGGPATMTLLYTFQGSPDGYFPWGRLLAGDGKLYGTTLQGGTGCQSATPKGCGTVFALTRRRTGNAWSNRILYSFQGSTMDGYGPNGGLVRVGATLYGTTTSGGVAGCDCGTVFALHRRASGSVWTERILHEFAGEDGQQPEAGVIHENGELYGTTDIGGAGYGVVYSVKP